MNWLQRSARLLLFAALLFASPHLRAQKFEGRDLVNASLIADTTAIVPGRAFTAGLLLKMAPTWHTYWQYPGDAGIPTEIKWQLPAGWKAGPIRWPIPLKLTEPGEIQIYGYHDEVLLMTELTPPATIAAKSVHLAAAVGWLVCAKICVPGNGNVQLDLPVGGAASAANPAVFAKFRAQLSRNLPNDALSAIHWQREAKDFRLTISDRSLAQDGNVDFFPLPGATTVLGHPQRQQTSDGSLVFTIPFESAAPGIHSLAGLIVFDHQAWSLGKSTSLSPGPATAKSAPASSTARDLLKFLLFGFIGGFILNLMPCVLPVISLKIFGFMQHAGDSRAKIFGNGVAFSAGIFVWFVGLALLMIALKAAGHQITWAFQFTNPLFVVAMSAVVLVFALNLFGVFEITLSARASGGLLGWSAREGYAGSFFQGVFATVLATPCTAPFLGSALGFAFAASAGVILLMFVAIAAGMSAPYLLLTAQPAWLRFLPRPGAWMVRVKQFMGFLLIATLLFLLWVLGAERGPEAIVWTGAFLLVLSIVCWMKGSFSTPANSFSQRLVVCALMALLVLGGGYYFIGEKFRATRIAASSLTPNDWVAFTPERLRDELAQGRSVFVDFTAAWCITCKFNEASVLETAVVKNAFARAGVVKMKADWTNADPVITKTLQQFGRVGVPLYVLYPATSPDHPVVLPELLTQTLVLDSLQNAAPKVAAAH
ncbi:MAG TPA: thioredoxin family protein [Chthoniobacterales bacterium]